MSASSGDRAFAALQRALPTRALSTLIFHITQIRWRPFKNVFIRLFQRAYAIDLGEAQLRSVDDFEHFNAFFTRALKPATRPLPTSASAVACPVDGRVSQCGPITAGRLFQAKGHTYSALELLGGDADLAARLDGGSFCTIYLAPNNYHRIHMPVDGQLVGWRYVPGRLFSVNPATARTMPRLFARNERLVAHFETAAGPIALVMVGALFVGSLETVWAGCVSPPHRRGDVDTYSMVTPPHYARGDEIGRFNMGSTVILLAPRDAWRWQPVTIADAVVRMGQVIADVATAATSA